MLLIPKIDQGVKPLDRLGPDRAAIATIAAVRSPVFEMLFTQKADRSSASGTGSNIDFGQIKKLHCGPQMVALSGDTATRRQAQGLLGYNHKL